MKLKHRISAALTALALIFTLTDSSALGGIFSAAARAFASFSDIEFDTNDTNGISQFCADAPKANELFYYYDLSDINQITSLGRNGYFSDFTMTWYDSNGDKVQSDKAGYNKEYSMKMVFKKNLNKVFPEVINIVYQDSEKKVCTVPTVIDDEQNTITATFYFSATIKPEPVSAVFEDGQYIQFVNHVSGMKYLCHTTKKSIIDSLPQTALIYSQDDEVTTTADIIWATKSGLGENDYTFEKTSGVDYNPNLVTEQTFTLRGYALMPNDNRFLKTNDTRSEFYFYADITVSEADRLSKPEVDSETPPGDDYTENIKVILTSPYTIFYNINDSSTPIGGDETSVTDSNKLYKDGIYLSGKPGETVHYTIKAVAYDKMYRTSEPLVIEYSITLEPSSMENIPSVDIVVDPPVAGELLDTEATVAEMRGISNISAVSWTGGNIINGKADYNSRYGISIIVSPKEMFAFFSTSVTVNGKMAKAVTNPNGSLTITYTFPNMTDMLPLEQCKIVAPSTIVPVANGTSLQDIGQKLPSSVELEAPVGNLIEGTFPVTWDLSSSKIVGNESKCYDPKQAEEQQFTLTGKVELPSYIAYTPGTNTTTVTVYVGEAGTLVWPTASPPDTGGANGDRTFITKQEITLTAEQNAAIFYTIGSVSGYPTDKDDVPDPSTSGGIGYTKPIVLEGVPGEIVTYTIKAIATAPGMKDSPVNTFRYTLVIPKETVQAPTSSRTPGLIYEQQLDISLNTITPGAEIYYTMDNSAKKEEFKLYESTFWLQGKANSTKVYNIRCYAHDPEGKMEDSEIVTFIYTISLPKGTALAPYPDHASGVSYEETQTIQLSCDTPETEIYYTINSTLDPSKGVYGKKYTKSFELSLVKNQVTTYTVRTFAKSLNADVNDSSVAEYTFTIGLDYGVEKIELEKRPLKYSYYLGELLNVTGGKIKVTYDDGKTEIVAMTEDMIDDFDSWVLGQQAITISYKGCTTEFNIVVRKKSSDTSTPTDNNNQNTNTDKNTGDDKNTSTDTNNGSEDNNEPEEEIVSEPTMNGSAVKGWDQLQKKIKAASVGSRVVINLNGNTSVPADIINTAATRKVTLEFVVNEMISWVVDAGTLKKTVGSVSVGIRSKDVYIPSVLVDAAGDSEIVRMHLYGENKIGAMLYIKTGCKEKNRFVNLYRYDEGSPRLKFVSTSKVAANTGLSQLKPDVEGNYVLMLDTQTMLPGDADNSTIVDAKDAAAILRMMVGLAEVDAKCDYNNDGFVNALDSSSILRAVVGMK